MKRFKVSLRSKGANQVTVQWTFGSRIGVPDLADLSKVRPLLPGLRNRTMREPRSGPEIRGTSRVSHAPAARPNVAVQ